MPILIGQPHDNSHTSPSAILFDGKTLSIGGSRLNSIRWKDGVSGVSNNESPNTTRWLPMAPDGTRWHPMALDDILVYSLRMIHF